MRHSTARARAPDRVERFVHGMTVGTNALLEGKVARTALLATEGFTDIEELGRQARAELYRLCAGHPPPLVPAELRIPVPERCGPDGVLERTRPRRAAAADRRRCQGSNRPPSACSGAFAIPSTSAPAAPHSTRRSTSPCRTRRRASSASTSAAQQPLWTPPCLPCCAATSSASPARAVEAGLPEPEIMLSGGGVAPAAVAARHGSWTVLSGPAGGAVGAASAGAPEAVCLDMGGTSSDVSVVSGGRVRESGGREVAGRALAIPMVDVHTVGAGGGSIAWRDAGGALRVGPQSAGAVPGPACYGHGGEGADGHGRKPAARQPRSRRCRSPAAIKLDHDAAEQAVARACRASSVSTPRETARGHPARRERGDGRRRPRDDGRTRHRPARAHTDRLRRRRADARRGRGGGARHETRASCRLRPACCRRSGWWSRNGASIVVESVLLSGRRADREAVDRDAIERLAARRARPARHRWRRGAGPRSTSVTRVRRSSSRCEAKPEPRRDSQRVRRRARGALRVRRIPTRTSSS